MKPSIKRRHLLQGGLALACSAAAGPSHGCEYFAANLRVFHPWTRASAPGAATAMVSLKFDSVTRTDRLIGAETPVAAGVQLGGTGATAHLDLLIAEGMETELSEAGTHLLLVGLRLPLEMARAYPLALKFASGETVDAMLNVDYARFA